jgi:hypothetical protein
MSLWGRLKQRGMSLSSEGDCDFTGAISSRNLIAPKGNVWYVDSSFTNTGHGKSRLHPKTSITEALAVASDYDTIIVAPGDYDEGAALTITQAYLKIYGDNTNRNHHSSMLYSSTATSELVIIKAHGVEIAYLGLVQAKAREAIQIGDTAGQAYWKIHIHHCKFDGYGTGTYGIASGDTADAPDIMVNDNHFRSFATAAIQGNWTRGCIENNTIIIAAGTIGIEHVPNAGDRSNTIIRKNTIQGVNSTDTGIKLTGTPSAGAVTITENIVAGCATTITQAANNAYNTVNNFTSDGAGGALIDTVA